ncbi:MAG: FHA domain-containing protein [Bryobacterales bacterium]|nr:FHA domain-containing protein [Bryobacterales bacterium]
MTLLSSRTYTYLLLGATGGLLGWYALAIMFQVERMTPAINAARGCVFGVILGFAIGAYEGIRVGDFGRLVRFSLQSALLGAVAGALALPLADFAYEQRTVLAVHFRFFAGVSCWLLLGALLGIGECIGKGTQFWKGLVGGLAGATLGGTFCEMGRGAPSDWATQYRVVQALMVLGAGIAAGAAFVIVHFGDAWLVVESSVKQKLKGHRYSVSTFLDTKSPKRRIGVIGSGHDVDVYVPDAKAAAHHATVSLVQGTPTLRVSPEASRRNLVTKVNGRAVTECPIGPGDRIMIGESTLVFEARKR